MSAQPAILVTGAAGNLGQRLLPLLSAYRVIAVDMRAPSGFSAHHFESLDLGRESSCARLIELMQAYQVTAVVHLAFVIDPVRTGVLDVERQWQINVAGTARVMEAIAEVNRMGGAVRTFIYPSSVSVYGPQLPPLVKEDHPLAAHTLPYAVHKMEADQAVQRRARHLPTCSTFILRAHIFTGATMENYLVGALRGTPTGRGRIAARLRRKGTRLPLLLPRSVDLTRSWLQFLHVDDMARLISWILQHQASAPGPQVLNVASRGDAITMARCVELANAKLMRLPTWLCLLLLDVMWAAGISGFPPHAFPYMIGSFTMDLGRLRQLLGKDFEDVIHHTTEQALVDSFRAPASGRTATPLSSGVAR